MSSLFRNSLLALAFLAVAACGGQTRINPIQQQGTTQRADTDDTSGGDDDTIVGSDVDGDSGGDTAPTTDNDVPVTANDPKFGTACKSYSDCSAGMVCAAFSTSGPTLCTTPCVGSGKGGNDDCPSGWVCHNWESTTLDGLQVCYNAVQASSSAPFTTTVGSNCSTTNDTCQTMCDAKSSTCVAMCMANRDCESGEICRAEVSESTEPNSTDMQRGYTHVCTSSSAQLARTGAACSDDSQCDSGICRGQCNNGDFCGSSDDCGVGGVCAGTCVDHCRSIADCGRQAACAFWPMVKSGYGSSWVPVCSGRLYNGSKQLGASCSYNSDCQSEACIGGVCTTPCATADDCAALMPGTDCAGANGSYANQVIYSASYCQ